MAGRKGALILDTARQMFLERGYDATSLDDVAAASGVSKTTVYNNFEDKEGLFSAVVLSVTERAEQIISELGATLRGDEPVAARLTAVARALAYGVLNPAVVQLRRLAISEALRILGPRPRADTRPAHRLVHADGRPGRAGHRRSRGGGGAFCLRSPGLVPGPGTAAAEPPAGPRRHRQARRKNGHRVPAGLRADRAPPGCIPVTRKLHAVSDLRFLLRRRQDLRIPAVGMGVLEAAPSRGAQSMAGGSVCSH